MTSFSLHILAMIAMLCDHIYKVGILNYEWLTYIGRISFPIFAFMIVEGYFKTKNIKNYVFRLFIFALISEIPFNLMVNNSIFYLEKQNVLWTFLIGIGLIWIIEKTKNKQWIIRELIFCLIFWLSILLGITIKADYGFIGIFTLLIFYFFRKKDYLSFSIQLLLLYILNVIIMNKLYSAPQQSFALLSLIPIWLYDGRQGYYNNYIKYIYYSFYPLHLIILIIIYNFLI